MKKNTNTHLIQNELNSIILCPFFRKHRNGRLSRSDSFAQQFRTRSAAPVYHAIIWSKSSFYMYCKWILNFTSCPRVNRYSQSCQPAFFGQSRRGALLYTPRVTTLSSDHNCTPQRTQLYHPNERIVVEHTYRPTGHL